MLRRNRASFFGASSPSAIRARKAASYREVPEMSSEHNPTPFVPYFPLDASSLRASRADIVNDGGSFLLLLVERRAMAGRDDGMFVEADYETGRFSITPIALANLREQIDQALAGYKAVFKQDPPSPKNLPVDRMDIAKRIFVDGLATAPENPDGTES